MWGSKKVRREIKELRDAPQVHENFVTWKMTRFPLANLCRSSRSLLINTMSLFDSKSPSLQIYLLLVSRAWIPHSDAILDHSVYHSTKEGLAQLGIA